MIRPQVEEAELRFFRQIIRLSTRVHNDLFRLFRDCLVFFFIIFSLLFAVFVFFVEESVLKSPQILTEKRNLLFDLQSSPQFSILEFRKSGLASVGLENGPFGRLAEVALAMAF